MIFNVLSLGAGVQSTALYLKFARGEMREKLDAAIFADTQDEPAAVYRHLAWLKSLGGPPILTGTAGKLSEHLMAGVNPTGQRFASIPAFTTDGSSPEPGRTKRQCSKEYKTQVIGKVLRREILGLAPKKQVPRGVEVNQFIGISLDEAGRAMRLERKQKPPKYLTRRFALIEANQTRSDCVTYNADKVPHAVPRSACKFCPYHDDFEWAQQRDAAPGEFAESVAIDHALRGDSIMRRRHGSEMYLHRSCRPLELVQFDLTPPTERQVQLRMNFAAECDGVCGLTASVQVRIVSNARGGLGCVAQIDYGHGPSPRAWRKLRVHRRL